MPVNLSPLNLLFILAYAFDIRWEYPEEDIADASIKDSTFFELLVFVLSRWTEELVKKGLYRTFIDNEEETHRLRGRVLFENSIKTGRVRADVLLCDFDELSFDTLENQILLSTLELASRELRAEHTTIGLGAFRRDLSRSVWNNVRLLSSEVSFQPLLGTLFSQLQYHRLNLRYKPVLEICRIIYDSAGLQGEGRKRFFDIPESKISIIFERFLRNYLSEALSKEGLQVRKSFVSDWTEPADLLWGTSEHIPSISPDIVIWRGDQPLFVIDAKFYAEPVYAIERQYYGESDEDAPIRYKTHSGNLYQLISYTNYYNCDGLLIYAQTESGHFQELVRVKPRYYPPERSPRRFGFFTLDLSGNLEVFKKRMEDFTRTVLKLAHDKVS